MFRTHRATTYRPHARALVLASLAVAVALLGLVGCRPTGPRNAAPRLTARMSAQALLRASGGVAGELLHPPREDRAPALDAADGELPDGVTVFDDQYAAVAELEPALLTALRAAAVAAGRDGVQLDIDSGWRSRRYQEQLFRAAVARYGSPGQAARWVARPGTSAHEAGQAVDLGPAGADAWLSAHGAAYALCQIYANEPWHFELRPEALDHGCPAPYADPTDDPRMQR